MGDIEKKLGELFGSFGATLGDAFEAARKGEATGRERIFEQTLHTGDGPVQMRAGMSVRFGGLGAEAPGARDPAEPIRAGRAAASPDSAVRAPLVDIYETGNLWGLTAELPGVVEADVVVETTATHLILRTTGARRFHAEIALPEGLDTAGLERALVNGILDLRIPRVTS